MEPKKRGVTGRGLGWEFLNSLWILPAFFPVLNSVSFFYIGFSAKQHKWVFLGCGFLLCTFFFSPPEFMLNILAAEIWTNIAMVSWLLGIILCFVFRKEYLIRRDLLLRTGGNKAKERALKDKLTREYTEDALRARQAPAAQPTAQPYTQPVPQPYSQSAPQPGPTPQPTPANAPGAQIDVNTCSEEELAALPGVNAVLAKKAVVRRSETGGFADLDEFLQFLAVKPHFAVQIRERAVCSAPDRAQREQGRMLDL